MTPWLIPTRIGAEKEAAGICALHGAFSWAPERLEFCRVKDERRPSLHSFPAWPGYIFAEMHDDAFADIMQARERSKKIARDIWPTWRQISKSEWPRVMAALAYVRDESYRVRRQVEAGERVAEFNKGQLLELIGSAFVGQMVRFREVVEKGRALEQKLKVDHELLGRITVNAVDVRAAE